MPGSGGGGGGGVLVVVVVQWDEIVCNWGMRTNLLGGSLLITSTCHQYHVWQYYILFYILYFNFKVNILYFY